MASAAALMLDICLSNLARVGARSGQRLAPFGPARCTPPPTSRSPPNAHRTRLYGTHLRPYTFSRLVGWKALKMGFSISSFCGEGCSSRVGAACHEEMVLGVHICRQLPC